jgi:hypothetical protein
MINELLFFTGILGIAFAIVMGIKTYNKSAEYKEYNIRAKSFNDKIFK